MQEMCTEYIQNADAGGKRKLEIYGGTYKTHINVCLEELS